MKKIVLLLIMFLSVECFAQVKKEELPNQVPPTTRPPAPLENTDDVIFQRVEIEATFPGGMKYWREFLSKKLKGDVPSKNGAKKVAM